MHLSDRLFRFCFFFFRIADEVRPHTQYRNKTPRKEYLLIVWQRFIFHTLSNPVIRKISRIPCMRYTALSYAEMNQFIRQCRNRSVIVSHVLQKLPCYRDILVIISIRKSNIRKAFYPIKLVPHLISKPSFYECRQYIPASVYMKIICSC